MENNIENVNRNLFVEKIGEIKEKYLGDKFFPVGSVTEVSYSDLGKTLGIRLTGDVPTNFNELEIVIVHPESEKDGWIGKGKIGVISQGLGISIDKVPLPRETLDKIENIYREYCGKEYRERFYPEENINKFAIPGMITDILEKNNK